LSSSTLLSTTNSVGNTWPMSAAIGSDALRIRLRSSKLPREQRDADIARPTAHDWCRGLHTFDRLCHVELRPFHGSVFDMIHTDPWQISPAPLHHRPPPCGPLVNAQPSAEAFKWRRDESQLPAPRWGCGGWDFPHCALHFPQHDSHRFFTTLLALLGVTIIAAEMPWRKV